METPSRVRLKKRYRPTVATIASANAISWLPKMVTPKMWMPFVGRNELNWMVASPYAPVRIDSSSTISAMVATTFMAAGAPVSQYAMRSSSSEPTRPTSSTAHSAATGQGRPSVTRME